MKGWSIILFQRTQVDCEVDRTLVDSLVHGDGEPGGLVEVGVDVCEVGGVVVELRTGGVTQLALLVVAARLSAVLRLVYQPARPLRRADRHRAVADHVLEGRHTPDSLAQVVCPVLQQLVAGAAFVKIFLEVGLTPTEEAQEYQEESPKLDGTLHS